MTRIGHRSTPAGWWMNSAMPRTSEPESLREYSCATWAISYAFGVDHARIRDEAIKYLVRERPFFWESVAKDGLGLSVYAVRAICEAMELDLGPSFRYWQRGACPFASAADFVTRMTAGRYLFSIHKENRKYREEGHMLVADFGTVRDSGSMPLDALRDFRFSSAIAVGPSPVPECADHEEPDAYLKHFGYGPYRQRARNCNTEAAT